jgi:uncharacterized Zn finger protein (UPF0148 family)
MRQNTVNTPEASRSASQKETHRTAAPERYLDRSKEHRTIGAGALERLSLSRRYQARFEPIRDLPRIQRGRRANEGWRG